MKRGLISINPLLSAGSKVYLGNLLCWNVVVEHLLQSLASVNLLQPQLGRGGDQAARSGCCLKISCCQFCSDLFNGLYSPEEKKFSWHRFDGTNCFTFKFSWLALFNELSFIKLFHTLRDKQPNQALANHLIFSAQSVCIKLASPPDTQLSIFLLEN